MTHINNALYFAIKRYIYTNYKNNYYLLKSELQKYVNKDIYLQKIFSYFLATEYFAINFYLICIDS